MNYTLVGHDPVPIEDTIEWAKSFETLNRRVAETTIEKNGRKLWVSTVFLGLDHDFVGTGPPILFETMVFDHTTDKNRGQDHDMDRYSTWDEAVAGHEAMVKKWSS